MNTQRFEQYKEGMKEHFIGNECYSDEYRETQPGKGCQYIGHALGIARDLSWQYREGMRGKPKDAQRSQHYQQVHDTLTKLTREWITSYEPPYKGDDELARCLDLVFDTYWAVGEHPYFLTEEELEEYVRDCEPDEQTSD